MFLSREDKETHPDLTGIRVPEKAEKNNFCGFIRMGNKTWFCCTHYDPDGDMYYHCAVPAAALYLTTVFVSIGVLIAVLFFFPLMRMYTRLLLVDVVKSSKEKAPGYEFRKNLSILQINLRRRAQYSACRSQTERLSRRS